MDSADKEENPRAMAVALAYGAGSGAPKVVAKGKGLMADQIIKKAKESGVFVHESKELVSLLMQVDLDRHIPPGLYTAVAELLAWVYRLENRIIDNKAQHKTASNSGGSNNNET